MLTEKEELYYRWLNCDEYLTLCQMDKKDDENLVEICGLCNSIQRYRLSEKDEWIYSPIKCCNRRR